MVEPVRIRVSAERPYDVVVGRGLLGDITERAERRVQRGDPAPADPGRDRRGGARRVRGAGLNAHRIEVPGRRGRQGAVGGRLLLESVLGQIGMDRNGVVVGLGGGAVTDLAGFVAGTWMRGVRAVHVPTTLLGMVDAAVGGKAGINTDAGKNLVGVFHEPMRRVRRPGHAGNACRATNSSPAWPR